MTYLYCTCLSSSVRRASMSPLSTAAASSNLRVGPGCWLLLCWLAAGKLPGDELLTCCVGPAAGRIPFLSLGSCGSGSPLRLNLPSGLRLVLDPPEVALRCGGDCSKTCCCPSPGDERRSSGLELGAAGVNFCDTGSGCQVLAAAAGGLITSLGGIGAGLDRVGISLIPGWSSPGFGVHVS